MPIESWAKLDRPIDHFMLLFMSFVPLAARAQSLGLEHGFYLYSFPLSIFIIEHSLETKISNWVNV